ncbi:16878_t:CDS:2 [Acaulospora morrowiae]|uniref:16878_t:CDS:1 n=1 Tax=Acaulospora morrowiae TaxID=94023 RepID=A0A9N9FRL8_9GLOM|nr:16878_t:CDS:2 [Acaulospora morrowiae]
MLCKDSEQRRMFKGCSVSMLAAYLQLISNLNMAVYFHNVSVTLGMDNSYKVILAQGITWFGTKKAYLLVWNKEGHSKYEKLISDLSMAVYSLQHASDLGHGYMIIYSPQGAGDLGMATYSHTCHLSLFTSTRKHEGYYLQQ